ncbi:hypothetical protein [Nocardia carnea]|uniref:hypothetical protein n=1 Tax=Nocardia carnea TaxID=37328 RepID=UPI00245868A0|nr:hypothetical protein [Nocardia carnea]
MSSPSAPTATAVVDAPAGNTALRNLYFVRFGFAIVWAVLTAMLATTVAPAAVALLVIYPLFDVAAAVIDFRSSGSIRPRVPLYINMVVSLPAAVGLGFAAASGIPAVLRVWGVWAVAAGIVQLIVALLRYRLGGQWAMILSGGISVFAGGGFIMMAGASNASLTALAGYATLGGIFFLISAIRLHLRRPEGEAVPLSR